MGRPATLKVDIVTDADTRGIGQAESRLSKFGRTAGKIGKVAALGLGAVAAGAVVVGKKLFEMGDTADDSNARIRNIAGSMGIFGKQADNVSNRLIKLAEKQALATGVDQNTIKATQAKLLTFGALAKSADQVGGAFDRANMAAVDMAAAGFGSAEGNAVQLGKALNDPIKGITALNKSGVTFTETEKARITTLVESNKLGAAQAMILKAVETQVGGTAKAMSGGTDRMKVAVSQLGEKIGLKLVPIIDKASAWLVDKFLPAASRLGKFLAARLGPIFADVGRFITGRLVPAVRSLHGWFVDKIAPGIARYVTPIIAGLRAGFAAVSKSVGDNEPQLRKLGNVLKGVAEFVANKVMPILGRLIGAGFRTLGAVIGGVITVISNLVGWIDTAVGKIKDLVSWVGKIDMPSLPDLNPFGASLTTVGVKLLGESPSYDRRAGWSTASATSGGLRLLTRSAAALSGAGATVVDARTFVTVEGAGLVDELAIAQRLEAILSRHRQRLGTVLA